MRREILRSQDIISASKFSLKKRPGRCYFAAGHQRTIRGSVREIFPFDEVTLDLLVRFRCHQVRKSPENRAAELYAARETAFTAEILRKVERDIYLQVLDNLWMQHLENMDHLREGIHWMSVWPAGPAGGIPRAAASCCLTKCKTPASRRAAAPVPWPSRSARKSLTGYRNRADPRRPRLGRQCRANHRGRNRIQRKGLGDKQSNQAAKKKQTDTRKKPAEAERQRKTAAKKGREVTGGIRPGNQLKKRRQRLLIHISQCFCDDLDITSGRRVSVDLKNGSGSFMEHVFDRRQRVIPQSQGLSGRAGKKRLPTVMHLPVFTILPTRPNVLTLSGTACSACC